MVTARDGKDMTRRQLAVSVAIAAAEIAKHCGESI